MANVFIKKHELKKLREEVLGISLRNLDKFSGGQLKASTIHAYESGVRIIPLEKVLLILKVYQKMYQELMVSHDAIEFIAIDNISKNMSVEVDKNKIVDASIYKTKRFQGMIESEWIIQNIKKKYDLPKITHFAEQNMLTYYTMAKIFRDVQERVSQYAEQFCVELKTFSEFTYKQAQDKEEVFKKLQHLTKKYNKNSKKEVKRDGKRSGSKKT